MAIDGVIPEKNAALLLLSVVLMFLGYQDRTALMSLGNFLLLIAAQKMSLPLRMELLRHLDILSAEYLRDHGSWRGELPTQGANRPSLIFRVRPFASVAVPAHLESTEQKEPRICRVTKGSS